MRLVHYRAVSDTLEPPTADMTTEAVSAGYYTSPIYQQKYPKLQILCIEDLLAGAKVKMPPTASTFKKAERVKKVEAEQRSLLDVSVRGKWWSKARINGEVARKKKWAPSGAHFA